MSRTIEVTLKFTQEDLDRLLEEVGDLPTVEELSVKQFKQLKKELQASADSFVEEIILGVTKPLAMIGCQSLGNNLLDNLG